MSCIYVQQKSSISSDEYCVFQGMRPSSSHASISSMGGMTPRESADSEALRGENCPSTASPPLGAVLEHPQTGVGNENLIATASSNGSSGEEFVHYNPLTHFVTGILTSPKHLFGPLPDPGMSVNAPQ